MGINELISLALDDGATLGSAEKDGIILINRPSIITPPRRIGSESVPIDPAAIAALCLQRHNTWAVSGQWGDAYQLEIGAYLAASTTASTFLIKHLPVM